ncbi:putative serine/threonine protein kinase [Chondromyces apiculatus DSM 436]|uniref:Putative serine/threonine protein kinase n=1 Tax=Chondromyces apiculatus DSM 436 TaxID=1192034 RepID=A0A017T1K4_9BACT|nr:putative serine/threonine protein kinase [Chondromyces apiculatus DSM 436]
MVAAVLLALGVCSAACSKSSEDAAPPAESGAPVAATGAPGSSAATTAAAPAGKGTSSATTGASEEELLRTPGPSVKIPAGKLVAGTACGDHPRAPGEELAGESVELGEFDIDVYPYPNDPTKKPATGFKRARAAELCEMRGRRLCTELEWERACKGPSNTRYEYGNKFEAKSCPTGLKKDTPLSEFEKCASGFGARAMHGYVWEWTASPWKRGKVTEGEEKGVLRGGFGGTPYANMRCTSVKAADPAVVSWEAGFRCCGGTANTAEVVIPAPEEEPAALAEEASVDEALAGRLQKALAHAQVKTEGTFSKVWRWRPAFNEELIVARFESKGEEGGAVVQPVVIRLCDNAVSVLGRMAGPVGEMGEPVVKSDAPGAASFPLKSGSDAGDVKFVYQFAQVATQAPPWVKAGGPASSASAGASAAPTAAPSAAPAAPTGAPVSGP